MSAWSRETPQPATDWTKTDLADRRHQNRRHQDRLPWPVAVLLIAMMSLAGWVAVWKGGAALLALLP
jgi:hypothetical protein